MLHDDGGGQGPVRVRSACGTTAGDAKGPLRCSLHALCMPGAARQTAFFPQGTVCMAQGQAQRVLLREEGAPQGQDLTRRKRCEVEIMHELIDSCEAGQVCTIDSILLQHTAKTTCVPAFEE